ncbi:MAG: FHA domain-containing protein [Planctomycetota bacterium]
MPYLVWDSPRGRVVQELDRSVLIIGRDEVSDFRVPHATVALRHALVQVESDTVRLTDLGSQTGTRINGARLAPEMPSTLEPGDFIQVGGVVLGFFNTPPPKQPAPAASALRPAATGRPRAAAPPPQAALPPAPASSREFPWRLIALGLAFVLVAVVGAWLATLRPDGEQAPADRATDPTPPPAPPPATAEKDEPEEQAPERAPANSLPPQAFVAVKTCPDLLEVDQQSYYPVRLKDFDASRIEAVGSDGKLYTIARGRVTKVMDRIDLARRAALERSKLASDDADGRLALASWCARRFVGAEARRLVQEVLKLRPDDEAAKTLQAVLEKAE